MSEHNGGWHLDKRVPVAIIGTILMQTAGGVWFAAGLHWRLMALEGRKDLNDRMVRMEQVVATNTRALERIERILERARFSSNTRTGHERLRRILPLPAPGVAPLSGEKDG